MGFYMNKGLRKLSAPPGANILNLPSVHLNSFV
jgi:hypothetical protein